MALIRAHRVTYVGELGWELYVPADMAVYCYERLTQAGAVTHCGLHVGDFFGREAVLRKKQTGLSSRLVQFQLEDSQPPLYDPKSERVKA